MGSFPKVVAVVYPTSASWNLKPNFFLLRGQQWITTEPKAAGE